MIILQKVEKLNCRHNKRNILKILSQDTRHTKIVDIASGTHRVSDELKRHSMVDDEGKHYTTNLDRNRYGPDRQYMVTVIQHNLSVLGLCPCLVDVEVFDQKNNKTNAFSADKQSCICEMNYHEGYHKVYRKSKSQKLPEGQKQSPKSNINITDSSPWTLRNKVPIIVHEKDYPQTGAIPEKSPFASNSDSDEIPPMLREQRLTECVNSGWNKTPLIMDSNGQSLPSRTTRTLGLETGGCHCFCNNPSGDPDHVINDHWERTESPSGFSRRPRLHQMPTRPSLTGIEPGKKRFKSSSKQLDELSEKFYENVQEAKSQLRRVDQLAPEIQDKDRKRIDTLEHELASLKEHYSRFAAEYIRNESKVNEFRNFAGQLFNCLQQLAGCKQNIDPPHSPHGSPDGLRPLSSEEGNSGIAAFPAFYESSGRKMNVELPNLETNQFGSVRVSQLFSTCPTAAQLPTLSESAPCLYTNQGQPIFTNINESHQPSQRLGLDVGYRQLTVLDGVPVHSALSSMDQRLASGYEPMLSLERSSPVMRSGARSAHDTRSKLKKKPTSKNDS
eukprot:g2040.t1